MMKKLQLLFLAMVISFTGIAQMEEAGPLNPAPNNNNPEALFDFEFAIDVGSTGSVGADGIAGVAYINNQYWVSAWASDLIHILASDGSFVETITIAGISGTRSITTDGTSLYIGTAGLDIFEVDPVAQSLVSTISLTLTSDAAARMVTYDETLDGGNGGFWVGNFSSDISSVDMSGSELSVIPAATHGTVIYGGAIDNVSPGGPFLWIHDQSGAIPSRDFITQLDPSTGAPTGVVYDFTADGAAQGATDVLAGGLFITDEVASGTSLVGLCQCTPSNLIFSLTLIDGTAGVDENGLQSLTLSPNPATGGMVEITSPLAGEKSVAVYDVTGKLVIQTVVDNNLDVSSLSAGVYMVRINQNQSSVTKKLIVN